VFNLVPVKLLVGDIGGLPKLNKLVVLDVFIWGLFELVWLWFFKEFIGTFELFTLDPLLYGDKLSKLMSTEAPKASQRVFF